MRPHYPGRVSDPASGQPSTDRTLPDKAADTSAERPWPVRLLSMKIAEYVDRMSQLWVEGQVVQAQRRPGANTAYLVLRDADVDTSLTLTMSVFALDAMATPLREGQRVVVQAKPTFWTRRGTLQLEGRQIRPVGEGDLLARIEQLKRVLAAEGVFDADRKKPLPFLPRRVGLICGRASAAQRDVVENARRRWPGVAFDTREVPVQGPDAVAAVLAALADLDAVADVDVIVLARGGGSFEDLLPFSNEALVRISDNVQRTQEALGRSISLENPSHYLPMEGHDWDEIDFLAELARRTGCGLLLDVNNVHVSAHNLGFDAAAYLTRFPAHAISEIHLAGHSHDAQASLLIDSHDATIAAPVWALYQQLITRIGPRPTLIERDGNLPAFSELLAERDTAQALLDSAGARP